MKNDKLVNFTKVVFAVIVCTRKMNNIFAMHSWVMWDYNELLFSVTLLLL